MTLNKLSAYLLIPFSGFYITRLPLSPIYFFMIVSIYLAGILVLQKSRIKYNPTVSFSLIYLTYLLFSQVISSGKLNTTINELMSVLYFSLSYLLIRDLSVPDILKIARRTIQFPIPLLIYEAYYRITNPIFIVNNYNFAESESKYFYPFKFNSIMYSDSNFVGVFIVVLLSFAQYLGYRHQIKLKWEKCILFLLLLLTISRAAILVALVSSVALFFINQKISIFIKRLCLATFAVVFLLSISIYVANDESTLVKFSMLSDFFDYMTNIDIKTIIFGAGLGNSSIVLGRNISAHDIIFQNVIETGVTGLVLLMMFWSKIIKYTNKDALYVLAPFFLISLSAAVHAASYLYSILATIIILSRKSNAEITTA